jgi:hypothetical protein
MSCFILTALYSLWKGYLEGGEAADNNDDSSDEEGEEEGEEE